MFNKGDKVRKISGQTNIGDIFTISTANRMRSNYILKFDEISGDWDSDFFELVLPKNWCIKGCKELGEWQVKDKGNKCSHKLHYSVFYYTSNNNELIIWRHNNNPFDGFTEITFQQFKEFILKEKDTSMIKLNLAGYRKLHTAACNDWKAKLERRFGMHLLLNDEVEILDTDYDMMRNACDEAQHKVMDEVFGADHIKRGTPCLVSNDNRLWNLLYANGVGNFTEDKANKGYRVSFKYVHQIPSLNFLPD